MWKSFTRLNIRTAESNQGHGGVDYGAAYNGQHDSSCLDRLLYTQGMRSIDGVWQCILRGQNKTTTGSDTLAEIREGENDSGHALGGNQGHGRVDYGAAYKEYHDSSSVLDRLFYSQSRLNFSPGLSLVDEVCQDVQQSKTTTVSNSNGMSSTLAKVSLEGFLVKAGVVLEEKNNSGAALGANQEHDRVDYEAAHASASVFNLQSTLNSSTGLRDKTNDELWEVFLQEREMTTTAINPHARSSTLPEIITEGEKDSSPTLGADPVVLPQQNVPQEAPDQQLAPRDAMHQKEHIGGVEKVNESGEESYIEFGYAMNTGPLSCQTKQSLQQEEVTETEKDILALNHSRQMLNDALHVSGITVDAERHDTTIRFINKTDTKKKLKIKHKKFERDINIVSITEYFGKPLNDAAKSFNISRSTFKRICREHGVDRWPSTKRRITENTFSKLTTANEGEPSRKKDSAIVVQSSQKMNEVTVKALYNGVSIRFELSDSSGIVELEDNVIERLKLDRKMFSIKYKDDDGDWVLIACDKDVQKCMEISRSLENTTIKMLIDLPIHHCAP